MFGWTFDHINEDELFDPKIFNAFFIYSIHSRKVSLMSLWESNGEKIRFWIIAQKANNVEDIWSNTHMIFEVFICSQCEQRVVGKFTISPHSCVMQWRPTQFVLLVQRFRETATQVPCHFDSIESNGDVQWSQKQVAFRFACDWKFSTIQILAQFFYVPNLTAPMN